jgi:hypothetical protein
MERNTNTMMRVNNMDLISLPLFGKIAFASTL